VGEPNLDERSSGTRPPHHGLDGLPAPPAHCGEQRSGCAVEPCRENAPAFTQLHRQLPPENAQLPRLR
jgi:hypothetical protein